jgi:DNA gyrase/topoisomerase IV subunit B
MDPNSIVRKQTMDPARRTLIKVNVDDAFLANEIFFKSDGRRTWKSRREFYFKKMHNFIENLGHLENGEFT